MDSGAKGEAPWTFTTIPTNKAKLAATITGTEKVRGFVARSISLPAFGTQVTLNTSITSIANLVFTWSFKTAMAFAPIGSSPPIVGG